ncbi:PA2779 family protein [Ramlibacter sp. 2FC]|uniref:PA2779 family protein n=1 Tax=Ramlibacter sp. 2FC TaxID=2502188 RepID=UPI0010F8D129|nr:PA2779 family protein [Ramlibacter sp. 2FC]
MNSFKRLVSSLVIAGMMAAGLPLTAQAGIVTTEEVVSVQAAAGNRDKVNGFLARDDVRQALEAQGVDAAAALERVKAMSDAEVAQLAGRVDQLPAGGADALGILLTIFIVLLVTDILGFTKVFPFTRSIR